jgi:hypothetical protein
MSDIHKPLPTEQLKEVENWFAEVTKQDVEKIKSEIGIEAGAQAGLDIPLLGKLFSRFNAGLAANSEHQLEAKRVFRQASDQLIDLTNHLIRTANQQLAELNDELCRPRGVLLLFDNLDRYPSQAIDNLLTRGATLMRHLSCHAIYTVPVELRCKAGSVYSDEYDANVILPMSALRVRDAAWADTVHASVFEPRYRCSRKRNTQ